MWGEKAMTPIIKKDKTVYRAYVKGEMVPICQYCDNRNECDFRKSYLAGCDSFTKIISMRIR